MRKILETLRLREQLGFGNRQIARAIQTGHSTVAEYLRRADVAGINYQTAMAMGHDALERRLFPAQIHSATKRPTPNWAHIHVELKQEHVTLDLLWREHKQQHPDGLEYSTFCEHYRKWAKTLHVSMRQHHAPADKLFVDYAGTTIDVVDGATGEVRKAQVFVAVLGASNYTFVEATWTQTITTTEPHTHMATRKRVAHYPKDAQHHVKTPHHRQATSPQTHRHGQRSTGTNPFARNRMPGI